jgi:MHS family proline/betaine transporter-like MFS transporter
MSIQLSANDDERSLEDEERSQGPPAAIFQTLGGIPGDNEEDPSHSHSLELEAPKHPAPARFQTIAGIAGNILEWYDFAVFGFFADVLGKVFFPPHAGNTQLYESFAIFGGAFLMRPIGGMLMGWIGDTHGHKRALEISIFLMAVPTFAMGCLPTYDQVGSWSVVLLIIVRLLQGLSVGGQLMSSLVFTLEQHDTNSWGLYGSYVLAAANFGTLIGGLVAAFIRAVLSEEDLLRYGWRLPFLSGIIVAFCGCYLKFAVKEDFSQFVPVKNPLKTAFSHGRALAAACLVPMLWSAGFYLTFVWLAIYMSDLVSPPVPEAFWVNSCALFFSVCLLFPAAGIASDKYGRTRVMTVGGVAFALLAPLCIFLIGQGNAVLAFFAQSCLGICLSLWGAPMMAWLVESFPPEARLTSVAIGYNVAQAIMGSATPAIATIMADAWYVSPGFLLTGIALVSLFGLLCVAPAGKTELVQQEEEDVVDVTQVADKEIS